LAWQLHSLLFPSFTDTAAGLLRLLTMPVFWRALAISHQALLLGYAAAAVVGVLIGFVMGRSPGADSWLDPYVVVLLITPMSAMIPLVIIALGIGLLARALVVMLFAVVVIAVNVRAGIRALDPGWLEMVRSFGATESQLWRAVLLPGALPAIVTGLRLGLGRAFAGMIAVELLIASTGIGRLLLDFQGTFESAAMFALTLVLVFEVTVLLHVLQLVERRIAPQAMELAVE